MLGNCREQSVCGRLTAQAYLSRGSGLDIMVFQLTAISWINRGHLKGSNTLDKRAYKIVIYGQTPSIDSGIRDMNCPTIAVF